MHAGDPVPWRLWGAAALDEARSRRLPLLVSIGFFACAWCHVQQKQSFRDPAIAALMAREFVPVKVDREIDGALDAALQDFAEQRISRRGWPLLVLITPEGRPAEAELYEPRDATLTTLQAWATRWRADPSGVEREASRWVASAPGDPVRLRPDAAHADALSRRFFSDAMRQADMFEGGFGTVGKFPSAPQLLALLELQSRAGSDQSLEFLQLTLEEMQRWGLRHHVWGGFFRYTIDPGWCKPHFEKMLIDNALLALVYLRAAAVLDQPKWRAVALQTLAFMRTALWDSQRGAFASGLSAQDAQGVEGARHLWTEAQLGRLLPMDEWALIKRLWAIGGAPPFEHGHLALAAVDVGSGERDMLARAYQRLRAARAQQPHPRDDKLLAAGNGLALVVLSEALPFDADARRDAAALFQFIAGSLWDGRQLRKLAGASRPAELDDHAYLAWGLARYAVRANHAPARELGRDIARAAWRQFYSAGWSRERKPLLAGMAPQPMIVDTHAPSPSALLILASLELQSKALRSAALDALSFGGRPGPGAALHWATQTVAFGVATAQR